jgi:peptidyl-prolyl cis-trans isomerase D
MFDFVRTHTRLLQLLLLLVIFPSFVFFGVQGYSGFTEGANATVAKVDGQSITQAEWDQAHQRQIERMRAQMPGVDPKLLDAPEFKQQTLEGLLRQRVLLTAAQKLNVAVTDERLQRVFVSDPQFAPLRNPDNTVNTALLATQGMSSQMFAQQLRQDLSVRQVMQGLAGAPVAGTTAPKTALDALLQRREVQVQRFDTADFRGKVNPSDEQLQAYHKANEASFRAPEQASIEYAVLDLDTVKKGVTVPEDELRKYYEQNLARYTVAEERRAAHILVAADKDKPAEERAKAKAKAEALLAQVRANPSAFADVARKNSDDPGSKEQGGDLGFFNRDAMVKPFADTAFAMKPGEISNVVETDFGFHIIQLKETRGGERKPFETVRPALQDEVGQQLAQRRYAEAAEQFSNLAEEQPDTLQPALDKLKLEKRTATVRREAQPTGEGALGNAKFVQALFDDEAVKDKRNTAAIEFGRNQMVVGRVVQHQPARLLPLAEVRDRVREAVVQAEALKLAREAGEARLAELKKGEGVDRLPTAVTLSRLQPQNQPREVIDAVMRAPLTQGPALLGTPLPGGQGYAVLRVVQSLPPQVQPEQLKALQDRYLQTLAEAEAQAYYQRLRSRYKAEVKVRTPVAEAPSDSNR